MTTGPELSPEPRAAWRWLLLLAAVKLLVQAPFLWNYGYFRDELYFLDCARHWQWGYVDDAPMIAALAKGALLLGGSLPAVRILPALAGAATVVLAGLVARALGGRSFAQAFAGLCVLAVPIFLLEHGLLCVGAFEPLVWMGFALVALRIERTGDTRLWLAFGALAGLGVMLKYTTGLVLACFLLAMISTNLRRHFRSPMFYAGAALALAILLPTLAWQIRTHWPLLTDLATIRRTHKNAELPPLAFLLQQVRMVNPFLAPLWIAGLVRLLRRPSLRFLGLFHLFLVAAMMALHGKDYYLAAAYPLLFAAGAVALQEGLGNWPWRKASQAVLACGVVALALLLVPAFTPLLPPAGLAHWQARLGIQETKAERSFSGPLMQPFGDQFGWPEMARDVAAVYGALPPTERRDTGIFTGNYGEAGALTMFGPALGLPRPICAHNAWSFWGLPARTPGTLICLGADRSDLEGAFASVTLAAEHRHPWGMGSENQPIYVCRGPKRSLAAMWPEITFWN